MLKKLIKLAVGVVVARRIFTSAANKKLESKLSAKKLFSFLSFVLIWICDYSVCPMKILIIKKEKFMLE
ncbi:hypothetical protein CSUNSWCD_1556 [Campylobacter showae CSUNSWCD]|uniref:Uncharacterized protein n=1 Tax=Campylobacter showae CSUNSWCD TaxID=1244083 RepID=M5IS47_9BACT|nr:hypothetical protein CSUNSWCD_1556 [Campylobacter showae CSUNSWCD]